jgi:hypothetical protein
MSIPYRRFNGMILATVAIALALVVIINWLDERRHPRPSPVGGRDPDLGWTFSGSRNQRELGFGDFELKFDSRGFRIGEIPPVTDGKPMFLGNSVTLGQHVPAESAFPGLLDGINVGSDGYDTYQQLLRYRRDLEPLNPAMLVLVVVGIDIHDRSTSVARIKDTVRENPDLGSRVLRLLDFGHARKALFSSKPKKEGEGSDPAYLRAVADPVDQRVWSEWTEMILELQRSQHGHFALVLSPPKVQVSSWKNGLKDFWVNEHLSNFCEQQGIIFLDLLPTIAAEDPGIVFFDHVHFTAAGHRVVARAIDTTLFHRNAGSL